MTELTTNSTAFVDRLRTLETKLPALQANALSRFLYLGFPEISNEEWRFTDVSKLAGADYANPLTTIEADLSYIEANRYELILAAEAAIQPAADATSVILFNGLPVAGEDQDPALGVSIRYLSSADSAAGEIADTESNPFTALNAALFPGTLQITATAGAALEQPIEVVLISGHAGSSAPRITSPRIVIQAGENSQLTIVETYISLGSGTSLTNTVTEALVSRSAIVDHYRVNDEAKSSWHVSALAAALDASSVFSSHSINLGAAIIRNEATALLRGEHAECTLNGLSLGDGDRLIDNHTSIDHASANCNSHEVYKAILNDRSRGVFNGKIFVRLDAQKTDAKQTNKTLLLSPEARVDTKPQLEILADDVKCTHGATIGQLDPSQVFYLRSRGLSEGEARRLLTYAFAGDIVLRLKVERLQTALDERLRVWLA